MKFFARVLPLSDNTEYADVIERAFYNAYLGALNTEDKESPYPYKTTSGVVSTILPFDAYSPLTCAKRGRVVGGYQVLPDMSYYGCCACIGAAGVGVFLENFATVSGDTLTINFFEKGNIEFECLTTKVYINIETDYPVGDSIKLKICAEKPVEFTLRIRNPKWSDSCGGYSVYRKAWSQDEIDIKLDMSVREHFPEDVDGDVV